MGRLNRKSTDGQVKAWPMCLVFQSTNASLFRRDLGGTLGFNELHLKILLRIEEAPFSISSIGLIVFRSPSGPVLEDGSCMR